MENFFSYNKSAIHYKKCGSYLPIVLLIHGFAEDGNIWNDQVDFLQKHFTLIIPELPGSGSSGIGNEAWTIEAFAEAIYKLMCNEKIESCIMIGHSMGGYVTLAFAEKYPAMLKGFGFINSTAFADSSEKKENRKKGIEFIKVNGAYSFIRTSTPNLFSSHFKKEHPETVTALIENGKNYPAEVLQQYYRAMMQRPDKTKVLYSAKIPVLFVIGMEDAAVPLNDILQQVHLPSTSYIHIFENTGHMAMWEAAEKVNAAILNFVQDTDL